MSTLVRVVLSILMVASVANAKATRFVDIAHQISEHPEKFEEVDLVFEDLDRYSIRKLIFRAEQESQIWYDTILEGDYILQAGAIALTAVSAVYDQQGEFVAFRISYAKPAWDSSTCDVNWDLFEQADESERNSLMKDCTSGFIVGSSFVSPNLRQSERDYNAIEDFQR